jgi:hypothetical protein
MVGNVHYGHSRLVQSGHEAPRHNWVAPNSLRLLREVAPTLPRVATANRRFRH